MLEAFRFRNDQYAVLSEFVETSKISPNINSMAIVGSVIRSGYDLTLIKDLDILVLTKEDSGKERENFIASLGFPFYRSDDALRFPLGSSCELSLVFQEEEFFQKKIAEMLTGFHIERVSKQWMPGGFIPEVFFKDISEAIIVFDHSGVFTTTRDLLRDPQPKYRAILMNYLVGDVRAKINYLSHDQQMLREAAFVDIKISLLRLIYTMNEAYFSGLKYCESEASNFPAPAVALVRRVINAELNNELTPFTHLIENVLSESIKQN